MAGAATPTKQVVVPAHAAAVAGVILSVLTSVVARLKFDSRSLTVASQKPRFRAARIRKRYGGHHTSIRVFRTGVLPRWIALAGFACALIMLLAITHWPWIAVLFLLWILVLGARIPVAEFHRAARAPAEAI